LRHSTFSYLPQSPRTTLSGRKVKFTPKYIIVGGEGGVYQELLRVQSYSFGNLGPLAKYNTLAQPLLEEFGWGLLLFLFLLPCESKVNYQFWTGFGVWQLYILRVLVVSRSTQQKIYVFTFETKQKIYGYGDVYTIHMYHSL
jgi:hypothetical protein